MLRGWHSRCANIDDEKKCAGQSASEFFLQRLQQLGKPLAFCDLIWKALIRVCSTANRVLGVSYIHSTAVLSRTTVSTASALMMLSPIRSTSRRIAVGTERCSFLGSLIIIWWVVCCFGPHAVLTVIDGLYQRCLTRYELPSWPRSLP